MKGWKALGNKLGNYYRVSGFKLLEIEESHIDEVAEISSNGESKELEEDVKNNKEKNEFKPGTEVEFTLENDKENSEESQLDLF